MTDILHFNFTVDWLVVLLPVMGFLLGYAIARRRLRKQKKKLRFSNDYFQGLNYLLNDQQDKALDIFIELVETDWETIDTSLALGAIFRRQGEIDKAIKLHQNLLARPSLPAEYKSTVLISLAKDYLQAGWLDRAEGLFKQVVVDEEYSEEAQKCLMSIYESEQEWDQAINIAIRYQRRGDSRLNRVIAQYYCELSQQMIAQQDYREAESLATQALNVDKDCVRASIMLADLAINRGRLQKAIRFLRQVEQQDIQMFPLVVRRLLQCYRNLSSLPKGLAYLQSIDRKYPDLPLLDQLVPLIEELHGNQAAMEYLSDAATRRPSLSALKALVDAQVNQPAKQQGDCAGSIIPGVVNAIIAKHHAYQCVKCGYTANTHVWLCPTCHSWSSMAPKAD
jgi:lipopolysaccharide biosynthesis regulator YciM